MSKCWDVTPADLLEQVLALPTEETVVRVESHQLGEGILRGEYEKLMQGKRAHDAKRKRQEVEDEAFARSLSRRSSLSPSYSRC